MHPDLGAWELDMPYMPPNMPPKTLDGNESISVQLDKRATD